MNSLITKKRVNLGNPEILKINLVSKLKNINNISGKEVIKWATNISGGLLYKSFFNLKKDEKKI